MRDELKEYYEKELTFIRQMGAQFAEKHPDIARRLLLNPNTCADPHAERMIESFALLAARVHLRIDDDFPQITQALLNVVYPHYLRPIPSMTVVEFHMDPERGKLTSSFLIPKTTVLHTRAHDPVHCHFRTCYDTTLWPLRVVQTQWLTPDRLNPPLRAPEAAAVLRLELECFPDVVFDKLDLESLTFYLNGEDPIVHALYELLCRNCFRIMARDPANPKASPCELQQARLTPRGFGENEEVLPYPRRSFLGYRLLQEYFAFPQKFFFLSLEGLAPLRTSGISSKAEILFFISSFDQANRHQRLESAVTAGLLRLGCTPIINLFSQTTSVMVDQTRHEYPVIPEPRKWQTTEVYSIDEVFSTDPDTQSPVPYRPLYAQHFSDASSKTAYWYATRRPSTRKGDEGTEVFLSLVDPSSRSLRIDYDAVTVRCTCTNRNLVSRLSFENPSGDFVMPGVADFKRIVALKTPTPALRPPLEGQMLWALISHLSLNYLSRVEGGRESLQEILSLYEFAGSPDIRKQIAGITGVESRRHFARVVSENGVTFARGTRVEMEFDEEQFSGGGVYLFASVLERFFGLHVSMNSFSQLVARSRQRKEPIAEWPPRAGQTILM